MPNRLSTRWDALILAFDRTCPTARRLFACALDDARAAERPEPNLFAEAAAEYHRRRPKDEPAEDRWPDPFVGDPDWTVLAWRHGAPLEERKRVFVELWNGFGDEDRTAFLRRVATAGELRRAAA